MLRIAICTVLLLAAAPAWAGCDEDTIDRISPSGTIRLQNGNQYDTYDPSASTWNEGDDVLICNNDTLINKDDNGEKVDATPSSGSMHDEDDDNDDDNDDDE